MFLMRLALGFLLWWISAWLLHVYVLMPKKSMPGSMFPVCVWDGARPMPMFLAERKKAEMPKRLCTEAVDYHEADRPYWLQLEEIAPATFHLQVWNDSMGDPFESAYQVASTHPERIIPLWQRRGANMARALSFFYAFVPSIVLYKLLFYLRARRLKKKQQASAL
ncbi:hypothetical protein CO610_02970 [Lysobacteraceae bacterium NML95-0200]|nr:hypothetical protein CO610_02970 [Xanthomonadaceae bacterium NML95-0200]